MSLRLRVQEWRARQTEIPYYRRTGFIGAALFVLAVLVAGLVLLLISPGGDETPPTGGAQTPSPSEPSTAPSQPTDEPPSTSPPPTTPSEGTVCPDLGDGTGQEAAGVGPDVAWSPIGDIAMAVSSVDGPAQLASVPAACYAYSAAGALLAGHNFFAEVNDPSKDATAIITERVEAGPVRDRLLGHVDESSTPATFAPVGYRFVDLGETSATVRIVYQTPGGTTPLFLSVTVGVAWDGEDWVITDLPDPEQVSGLPAGFVDWGPGVGALE